MNYQEATKHAQQFFKTYPKVDTFHITTDGQVFSEKHHADSHAKSLIKDKKTEPVVHTVERSANVQAAASVPTEKTQEEKDKEAAEKKAASIEKAKATKAKNAAAKEKS